MVFRVCLVDPRCGQQQYCLLLPSGNPSKCHEEAFSLQRMISPKRFDILPPVWDAQKA